MFLILFKPENATLLSCHRVTKLGYLREENLEDIKFLLDSNKSGKWEYDFRLF
jgi:hypothetical protein